MVHLWQESLPSLNVPALRTASIAVASRGQKQQGPIARRVRSDFGRLPLVKRGTWLYRKLH